MPLVQHLTENKRNLQPTRVGISTFKTKLLNFLDAFLFNFVFLIYEFLQLGNLPDVHGHGHLCPSFLDLLGSFNHAIPA